MKIDNYIQNWAKLVNESENDEKWTDIYDGSLTYDKLTSKYEDVPPNGLWDDDSKDPEQRNSRAGDIWTGAIKFACAGENNREPRFNAIEHDAFVTIYINDKRFEVIGRCFSYGDRLFAFPDSYDEVSEVIYKDGKYKFIAVKETLQDLCKDVSSIYVYDWDLKEHTYVVIFKQEDAPVQIKDK